MGLSSGVIVHLHLLVDLHVLTTSGDVLEELVDSRREVDLLLAQGAELGGALLTECFIGASLLDGLVHIVDLQREDGETVDSPSGGSRC